MSGITTNGVTDTFGGGLDSGIIDDQALSGYMDVASQRTAWGREDSILGTPEFFPFPVPFGAPPVVQITRGSPGTPLTPRQVSTTGFVIDRADTLPNPIPFSWTATGITAETVAPPSTRFNVVGLPVWSAAVRAQRAGKRNARIMCVGDSTTMGYGANGTTFINNDRAGSYPTQLAGILTARGSKGGWGNWIGNANTGPNQQLYDTRISKGASWGDSSVPTAGGFTARNSGSPTAHMFTPTEAWDTAEVYIFKGDASATMNVNLSIDAALKSSVSTMYFDTTNGNSDAVIITSDSPGLHVLSTQASTTGVIHMIGAVTYNSTIKEVTVLNAGWGGATAAAWGSGTQTLAPWAMIKTFNPDLVIINLGINDGTPTDPLLSKAQFKSQVQVLINAARNNGADVLLVAPNDGSPVDFGARYGVLGVALQEMAAEQGLKFINLRDTLGTWAEANANGYMRDAVHPNASGYGVIATAIADVIMPAA